MTIEGGLGLGDVLGEERQEERVGLPSVIPVGNRLAVFYDAPGGDSISHMNRDVGLAWLNLPLLPP